MSALTLGTDIPSQINTVEKLSAWCGLVLANQYPNALATEGPNYSERVAQAGIFYIPAAGEYRLLLRQSLLITPDYLAGGAKMWTYAQQIGTDPIPVIFKSN